MAFEIGPYAVIYSVQNDRLQRSVIGVLRMQIKEITREEQVYVRKLAL